MHNVPKPSLHRPCTPLKNDPIQLAWFEGHQPLRSVIHSSDESSESVQILVLLLLLIPRRLFTHLCSKHTDKILNKLFK